MGDVGDGDVDDEAARVLRIGVRPREHRVVVVLGVDRIDGDERHVAPVLASDARRRLRCFGLAQGVAPEHVGDAVGVDGDQADRFLRR